MPQIQGVPTLSSSKLLATTLLLPLIAGCAGSVDSFRDAFGRQTATLNRSTLEAMPCIGDAIRTTFGVEPKSDGSYLQMGSPRPEHVKMRMTVALTPSESGVAQADARTIVYDFYNTRKGGTGVSYSVDFKGAMRDEWLEQAFLPLAQCGAVKGKK